CEIDGKRQAGVIFVEVQNGARQRISSVKYVSRDAGRHPNRAKYDEVREGANWLQNSRPRDIAHRGANIKTFQSRAVLIVWLGFSQEFSSSDVACHVTLRLGVIDAMEG